MFHDTKSHPDLLDDKEFIEKSVDSHLNSHIEQTRVISQKHLNAAVAKCDSILTSIDKYENDRLSGSCTSGRVETEENDNKSYENSKTISIIDNAKEEKSYICCGNPGHIFEKVFKSTEQSSEDLKRSRSKKRAFSLLDTLISASIIAPLAIGFWRGVWASMDCYAELFPSWFCFMFGVVLHAAYAIFKHQFHNVYMKKWVELSWRKRLPYRALRILYTYTFGVACIAHWRGGWIIIDNYLFTHTWITTSLTCSLLACLAILRSIRNLIATPLITIIDTPSCIFQFPTRYNMVS